MAPTPAPPDTLNEVGVLKRREIEARILIPVLRPWARSSAGSACSPSPAT